jgi:hypothetical protein
MVQVYQCHIFQSKQQKRIMHQDTNPVNGDAFIVNFYHLLLVPGTNFHTRIIKSWLWTESYISNDTSNIGTEILHCHIMANNKNQVLWGLFEKKWDSSTTTALKVFIIMFQQCSAKRSFKGNILWKELFEETMKVTFMLYTIQVI